MDKFARILAFDPSSLLAGVRKSVFQRFERYQAGVSITDLFPITGTTICACGCGQDLTGRRRRWATSECNRFACAVFWILKGDRETIARYLEAQHGYACKHCGVMYESMEVDHVLAVKLGGGGHWLDNYQFLCKGCHNVKSKIDNAAIRNVQKAASQMKYGAPDGPNQSLTP